MTDDRCSCGVVSWASVRSSGQRRYKWRKYGAPAEYYLKFIDYAIEQCTAAVTEAQFGPTLLKNLDEWNYVIWTKSWIEPPA